MREKKLVSASGKDIYLPDVDKDDRMDSAAYRKHINRLDMPICFIVSKRKISLKSTMKRMALSYVHNKEIRKAKCHGFMETKTKVDALFNILFYIYHNNGNNTRKKCLLQDVQSYMARIQCAW